MYNYLFFVNLCILIVIARMDDQFFQNFSRNFVVLKMDRVLPGTKKSVRKDGRKLRSRGERILCFWSQMNFYKKRHYKIIKIYTWFVQIWNEFEIGLDSFFLLWKFWCLNEVVEQFVCEYGVWHFHQEIFECLCKCVMVFYFIENRFNITYFFFIYLNFFKYF